VCTRHNKYPFEEKLDFPTPYPYVKLRNPLILSISTSFSLEKCPLIHLATRCGHASTCMTYISHAREKEGEVKINFNLVQCLCAPEMIMWALAISRSHL